jgi:ketosteroid isomerase-like protein
MEFLQAKYFTPAWKRQIDLMVIHDMEMPEKGDTAESCAQFFHRGGSEASAHYCIDNDSVVNCVHDMDIAWAAPGANRNGLHFEHAGYARQTAEDWSDAYSQQMMSVSAALVADKCKEFNVPMAFVSGNELRKGYRGITTHYQITLAFATVGGHTDPGPNFPMAQYISMVQNVAGEPIHQEVRVTLNAPIVAIMARPQGDGYWEVGADGGIFNYGEAKFHGSLGNVKLNAPIVDGVATPTGNGYWLVAGDGGIFAFGDAGFMGAASG